MKITVYTVADCKFSQQEKEYLTSKNIPFEEKNLETNREFLTEMLAVSNNFAGTPVTKIEKDDGSISVLKGFTQSEFEAVLNGPPASEAAPEGMQASTSDTQTVAPAMTATMPGMTTSMDTAPAPAVVPEPTFQAADAGMTPPPVEEPVMPAAPAMPSLDTNAMNTMPAMNSTDTNTMQPPTEPTAAPAMDTPAAPAPFQMPEQSSTPPAQTQTEPMNAAPAPFQMPEPVAAPAYSMPPQQDTQQTAQPVAPDSQPAAPQNNADPLSSVMSNLQQKANS